MTSGKLIDMNDTVGSINEYNYQKYCYKVTGLTNKSIIGGKVLHG